MGLVGAPLVSPSSRPACWTPAGLGREPPTCTTHPSFRLAPIIIIFIVVIIIAIIFINVIIIQHCRAGAQNPSGKTILLTILLQPTIQYFFSQKRAILLKMGRYFLVHVTAKTIEGLGPIVIFIRFSSSWSRSYGHHRHDHIVIIVIIISSSSS